MTKFNFLNSVSIDPDTVRTYREKSGVGLMEAKSKVKADALINTLYCMRYRVGDYEDYSSEEILDELLGMLIMSVET